MRISDWSSDVCSSDLLAAHQIGRLNAVGAFVDRGDARVAIMLRGAGFLDEAHAAMDLHAEARDLAADVGRVRLDHRDEDVGAHRGGLDAQFSEVDLRRGVARDRKSDVWGKSA